MAIPTILQGDDTAANGRSLSLTLPDVYVGDGYTVAFEFQGLERTGAYSAGGSLAIDFTAEETSAFPLGVQLGKLSLRKDGLTQTISNTIPVLVTDCVSRADASAAAGNEVNVNITIQSDLPPVDVSRLTKTSTIAEMRDAVNAILAAFGVNS